MANIIDQLSKSSNKVLFLYNLQTNKFDYLSQAVEFIWEEKREVLLASPAYLISGIDADDQEAVFSRFEKVRQGTATEVEFDLRFPDESVKQVKVDAHPILNAAGTVTAIAGLAEDVTKQAQYLDYLLEFGQKKDNVLQVVAHDLQGPLSIAKNVASLLQQEHLEFINKETSTYFHIIDQAFKDCIQLIHDVLKDEHVRSVKTVVNRERFDVVAKVREIADAFTKSKVIETAIEVTSSKEKIMAELDEIKFFQIFNNLITNSVKFTPPEGKILISIKQQGTNLLLTHTDTGIGIPLELQPYLFDKSSKKALRLGLKGQKPNGVGLTIIRDLVEAQDGSMKFESIEHKGTSFYISFPACI